MKKFLQIVAAPKVLETVGVSWKCAFQVSGAHTLMIKECQQFESGWGQISSQHPAPLVLPVSPAKLDLEKFMKLILAFSTTSPSVLFLAWAHSL